MSAPLSPGLQTIASCTNPMALVAERPRGGAATGGATKEAPLDAPGTELVVEILGFATAAARSDGCDRSL